MCSCVRNGCFKDWCFFFLYSFVFYEWVVDYRKCIEIVFVFFDKVFDLNIFIGYMFFIVVKNGVCYCE